MLIKIPITAKFIKSNNDSMIFVYGNDCLDRCIYGQAEFKGMSNTRFVPVRNKCCTDSSAFFHDIYFKLIKDHIDFCISNIPIDGRLIIPFPKIGEGYSRMRIQAPKSWSYLMEQLNNIKAKDIEYKRENGIS